MSQTFQSVYETYQGVHFTHLSYIKGNFSAALKVISVLFLKWEKCVFRLVIVIVSEQMYSIIPLFLLAKSRDASHSKMDFEVVPKVARMTVSGKKQTMGFDVPRYLTQIFSQKSETVVRD